MKIKTRIVLFNYYHKNEMEDFIITLPMLFVLAFFVAMFYIMLIYPDIMAGKPCGSIQ